MRSSKIQIDGVSQGTIYVSDTQLTTQVPASAIATASATFTVTVFTSPPGGGTSNAATLEVVPPNITLTPDVSSANPGRSHHRHHVRRAWAARWIS